MRLYSLGAAPRTLSNCHPHSHELWEISVNVLGEGKTWIGEECYSFTEGTILCIPPGMEHSKRSQEGFVDYYFHTEEFLTADNRRSPRTALFCCRMTAKRALRGWCGSF